MAVVIRLQRTGKPHQPYYRVVAIEKARAASGKPVEILGTYNPREELANKKVVVDTERYEHWVKVGAKPSDTVASLIKRAKKAVAAPAK
jgi:small subunit ribosomal protein S16